MPDFEVHTHEEWAKWQALYARVSDAMALAGANGSLNARGDAASAVMDALHAIDGGTHNAAIADAPQRPAVTLGDELFAFKSLTDWINNAKELFANNYPRSRDAICIDTKGRICSIGEHFRTASDEDSYPIRVFMKRSA